MKSLNLIIAAALLFTSHAAALPRRQRHLGNQSNQWRLEHGRELDAAHGAQLFVRHRDFRDL